MAFLVSYVQFMKSRVKCCGPSLTLLPMGISLELRHRLDLVGFERA